MKKTFACHGGRFGVLESKWVWKDQHLELTSTEKIFSRCVCKNKHVFSVEAQCIVVKLSEPQKVRVLELYFADDFFGDVKPFHIMCLCREMHGVPSMLVGLSKIFFIVDSGNFRFRDDYLVAVRDGETHETLDVEHITITWEILPLKAIRK